MQAAMKSDASDVSGSAAFWASKLGSLTAKQKPKDLESSQGLIFLSSFKELLLRNMQ